MKTVNVIEYFDETIQSLHAFEDNPEGNKEAEEVFRQLAEENECEDVDVALEDGYYEVASGYQVFIVHNSN